MPTSPSAVHVSQLLSNVSVAFLQKPSAFVADKVFPVIPVQKQADKYLIVDRGEFNRDEMMLRADSSESAGGNFSYSQETYFCDVFAFHKDIGDQVRANADSVYQLERLAAEYLAHKALIKKEKKFASDFLTTSVWTADRQGVASGEDNSTTFRQFSDYSNSDPINFIRAQATVQQQLTGYRPNTLVMGRQVYEALIDHPDIIDRIKYGTRTNLAQATKADLASLLDLDNIYVMDAIENTAAEGLTASHSFIGGKKMLLCYVTPTPGQLVPTSGYTFAWNGLMGNAGMGTRVKKFRMENISADRIEIEMAFDQKKVSADMGTYFYSVVA